MSEDDSERPAVRNPFSDPDGETADADPVPDADDVTDDATGEEGPGGDAPFAGLAAEARKRRREGADDDPFEPMEVLELDREGLWASLTAAEPESEADPVGAAERVGEADDREEHVVNKREYCQRCRYLSDPPDVSCGHDGTDIVEVVDADRFRVRGCPMVSDDEGAPDFGNR